MFCSWFAGVRGGDLVFVNCLGFVVLSGDLVLEGEHCVGNDCVLVDPVEFLICVYGGVCGRRVGGLAGLGVAGGVGIAERNGSISVTPSTYWYAEAIGG